MLVEIEELAKLAANCEVQPTGCLGYCNQGPAVAVVSTLTTDSNTGGIVKSRNRSRSRRNKQHSLSTTTSIHVSINSFDNV